MKKRSPLPLIIAVVLLIIAVLLLILSRSQSPDQPKTSRAPQKPDSPIQALPNRPEEVDPKKKSYKGAYTSVAIPRGYKIRQVGASPKGDLIIIDGNNRSSIMVRTDAARASEPLADRAYFNAMGSKVTATLFRGQPAYLLTTRYKEGFMRFTYLTQADGRNYNISIYGKKSEESLLKKKLLATVKSISPVGPPPR